MPVPQKRIVFMGTPAFALPSLEALLAGEHSVVAVYTQPDRPAGRGRGLNASPVKRLAESHGLPVMQPVRLKEPQALRQLQDLAPDAIVVAAFGQLLPKTVLDIPPFGCINVHPSLLPRHRGPSPIPWAILEGDEVTGVTIMLMDPGMDTGPILAQREEPVLPQDTAGSLGDRLAELSGPFLAATLNRWLGGEIRPAPQDNSRATYSKAISKDDGDMDWNQPAAALWRRVKAFQPWPGCYTWWQGRMLKVLRALPLDHESGSQVGEVLGVPHGIAEGCEVGVQTGRGVLCLLEVQLEGKKSMTAAEFDRGQRGFSGSVLPLRH